MTTSLYDVISGDRERHGHMSEDLTKWREGWRVLGDIHRLSKELVRVVHEWAVAYEALQIAEPNVERLENFRKAEDRCRRLGMQMNALVRIRDELHCCPRCGRPDPDGECCPDSA
jgi:hypothetical protein